MNPSDIQKLSPMEKLDLLERLKSQSLSRGEDKFSVLEREVASIKELVKQDLLITATLDRIEGKPGLTPIKGVDFFTDEEIAEVVEVVESNIRIPEDGKTPIAGVDFLTDKEIEDIKNSIAKDVVTLIPEVRTPEYGIDYFTDEEQEAFTKKVIEKVPVPEMPVLDVNSVSGLDQLLDKYVTSEILDGRIRMIMNQNVIPTRFGPNSLLPYSGSGTSTSDSILEADGTQSADRSHTIGAFTQTFTGTGGWTWQNTGTPTRTGEFSSTGLTFTDTANTETFSIDPNNLTITSTQNTNNLTITTDTTTANVAVISASSLTTGTVLDMSDLDSLTTGTAINVASNSASTSARSLVDIANNNSAADATELLTLTQAGNDYAIRVENSGGMRTMILNNTAGTSGNMIEINPQAITTGTAFQIEENTLTTGRLFNLLSGSTDTGTREIAFIRNDSPLATGAVNLYLKQDADNQALEIERADAGRFIRLNDNTTTLDIHTAESTTVTGALSQTAELKSVAIDTTDEGGILQKFAAADTAWNRITPFLKTVTSNYTVLPTDDVIEVDTSGGAVTVTLDSTTLPAAKKVVISWVAGGNDCIVAGSGKNVIDFSGGSVASYTFSVLRQTAVHFHGSSFGLM